MHQLHFPAIEHGAERGNRNPSLSLIKRLLCHLSYLGMNGAPCPSRTDLAGLQNQSIAVNAYRANLLLQSDEPCQHLRQDDEAATGYGVSVEGHGAYSVI